MVKLFRTVSTKIGADEIQESKELEQAHYLYPVDVKSILTNDVLKNIICRNFAS